MDEAAQTTRCVPAVWERGQHLGSCLPGREAPWVVYRAQALRTCWRAAHADPAGAQGLRPDGASRRVMRPTAAHYLQRDGGLFGHPTGAF